MDMYHSSHALVVTATSPRLRNGITPWGAGVSKQPSVLFSVIIPPDSVMLSMLNCSFPESKIVCYCKTFLLLMSLMFKFSLLNHINWLSIAWAIHLATMRIHEVLNCWRWYGSLYRLNSLEMDWSVGLPSTDLCIPLLKCCLLVSGK